MKKSVFHYWDTHNINDCISFEKLDTKVKLDVIRKNRACLSCLQMGHLSKDWKCKMLCDVGVHTGVCGKLHHVFYIIYLCEMARMVIIVRLHLSVHQMRVFCS